MSFRGREIYLSFLGPELPLASSPPSAIFLRQVLDPRNSSSSAAASLGFGSASDQKLAADEARRKEGRRGRDWVDNERKYDKERAKGSGAPYRERDRRERRDPEDHKPEWGRRR